MKPPTPKLSKTLTRRTKLTPAQLERARGQAGNGTASRYDSNGTQSLALTRKLVKAMKKAKRFVLYSDQLGRRVYVSTYIGSEYAPLTFDKSEALQFIQGFDEPGIKVGYWNTMITGIKFTTTHN